jgi:hypothetical protein
MSIKVCDIELSPPSMATATASKPEKVNLAWVCATVNAYSSILFCFVLLKFFRVMFSQNKSRN